MTELSPESRALLKGVRDDFEPDDEQRSRVGRALGARLGIAGGAIATTTAAGAAKAGAGLAAPTLLTAAKWVGAILLAGSIGAVGATRFREERGAPRPAPAASVPVAPPVPLAREAPAAVQDAPREEGPPSASVAPPQTAPAPGPVRRSPPTTRESTPTAAVAEEARLVRQARDSLRSGDAAAALRLLDEHARRFPDGVLAEERSAERVSALCKLGRDDEAREEGARFLRANPGSALASGFPCK
jgi:hypothetical protein